MSAWSTIDWESYARGFLARRYVLDPAGGIWLGIALSRMAPQFIKASAGQRTREKVLSKVASSFAERDSDEDADGDNEPRKGPSLHESDFAQGDVPGPAWLHDLSVCLWAWGAPHMGRRLQYPAIPEVVVEPLAAILAGRGEVGANGQIRVNGEAVGEFTSDRKFAAALGTVAAHRVLRFVVSRAWVRAVERIESPDEVVVLGGWSGLAHALGLESRSAAQDLQRAGEALAALKLSTPLGSEKLLRVRQSRRDTVTTLTLVATGPLAVDYTGRLRKAKKPDRLLVPLRPEIPVLTPQRSRHAQQLSFEMALLREFRLRVSDKPLVPPLRFGGGKDYCVFAELSDVAIGAAAETAGLSPRNVEAVLRMWRAPGDRGGWIARTSPGADSHVLLGTSEFMEAFMVTGWQMKSRGHVLGARSAKARAAGRPPKGREE